MVGDGVCERCAPNFRLLGGPGISHVAGPGKEVTCGRRAAPPRRSKQTVDATSKRLGGIVRYLSWTDLSWNIIYHWTVRSQYSPEKAQNLKKIMQRSLPYRFSLMAESPEVKYTEYGSVEIFYFTSLGDWSMQLVGE